MIIFGYAKDYKYAGDGTLLIRVRIPSIHGPWDKSEYRGRQIHNYVLDKNLPYYQSVLLPHLPISGEVVMLESITADTPEFVIIGLTGASYYTGATNLSDRYLPNI